MNFSSDGVLRVVCGVGLMVFACALAMYVVRLGHLGMPLFSPEMVYGCGLALFAIVGSCASIWILFDERAGMASAVGAVLIAVFTVLSAQTLGHYAMGWCFTVLLATHAITPRRDNLLAETH